MQEIYPHVEQPLFIRQNSKSQGVGHRMPSIEGMVNGMPVSPAQRQQRLEAIIWICDHVSDDLDNFLGWNREQRHHFRPEVDVITPVRTAQGFARRFDQVFDSAQPRNHWYGHGTLVPSFLWSLRATARQMAAQSVMPLQSLHCLRLPAEPPDSLSSVTSVCFPSAGAFV